MVSDYGMIKTDDIYPFVKGILDYGYMAIYPVVEGTELVGAGVSYTPHKGCFFLFSEFFTLEWFKLCCDAEDVTKIVFGGVDALILLGQASINVDGPIVDLQIIEHTLGNGNYDSFALDDVLSRQYGECPPHPHAIADYMMRLYFDRPVKSQVLAAKNEQVDFPLVRVLAHMSQYPVCINVPYLKKMENAAENRIIDLEQWLNKMDVTPVNANTLHRLLFHTWGLTPKYPKKKDGYYPLHTHHLSILANQNENVKLILELRRCHHMLSHYLTPLLQKVNSGQIFTRWNPITATTRLASEGPCLQNIPTYSLVGYHLRKAFIAPPGYKWIQADYSQVELIVLAHILSTQFGDHTMAHMINNGKDVHTMTATAIYDTQEHLVQDYQRETAKEVNFSIINQMGVGSLSHRLGWEFQKTRHFLNRYMEVFPGIKRYQSYQHNLVDSQGWVEAPFMGTCRHLKKGQYPQAINTPIQAGAAELIRQAMVDLYPDFIPTIQVHDELNFLIPETKMLGESINQITTKMCKGFPQLTIPLKVNVKIGDNWADLTPYQM